MVPLTVKPVDSVAELQRFD